MIAHLSGNIFSTNEHGIVLDVSGVGYKVRTTTDTAHALRNHLTDRVALWIHTVVREDALDLYGFQTEDELALFELLIGVSGIGPKSALGILGIASVAHLKEAIAHGNAAALTKVAGIGTKNAQKIILELRDKVGDTSGGTMHGTLHEEHDVLEGLLALGYTERDAREILKQVPTEVVGTSARIKYALKQLGGR